MNRPCRSFQTRSGSWMWMPPPEPAEFHTWVEPTPYIDLDLTDLNLCPGPTCLLHGQPHEHAWHPGATT